MNTVKRILDLFGISDDERNLVIWNTGVDFSRQFSHGEEMLKDGVFWAHWKRIFESDDVAILKNPDVATQPYSIVKDSLSTDDVVKKVFCRNYFAAKNREQQQKRAVDRQPNPMNQWRKRLIAAVGGWLRMTGREDNLEVIKGVVCRAAGIEDFNAIPKSRLISLYNAFLQKQKDVKTVSSIN